MNNNRLGIPLSEVKAKLMKDPAFVVAYEELQPTFDFIRQMIDARLKKKMTQADLAKKIGTRQSNISRLEGGDYNPSLKFLKKVAAGLGKKLKIVLY